MMTLEEIKEYCAEAFKKGGYDFEVSGITVTLNGRLTRTLGRCYSECINGVYTPARIEISRQLIETSTDDSIIAVIEHECCHALVALETGERHGHDAVFKAMCARIGCINDGTTTHVERTVANNEVYKYSVFCSNDGFLRGYSRMCSTLKNLSNCYCPKCKQMKLYYVQNK